MSVRMAFAKLCASAAGGAIIGGGAVHVAQGPMARPAYVTKTKSVKRVVKKAPVRVAKRLPRRTVKTVASCAPTTVSVATPAALPPVPYPFEPTPSVTPQVTSGGPVFITSSSFGGPIIVPPSSTSTGGVTPSSSTGGTPTPTPTPTPSTTTSSTGGTPTPTPTPTPSSTTTSTGGTPVPGPPMMLLFGIAATGLIAGQRWASTKKTT